MKLLSLEGLTKIEYFIMISIVTKVLIQKLKKKNGWDRKKVMKERVVSKRQCVWYNFFCQQKHCKEILKSEKRKDTKFLSY